MEVKKKVIMLFMCICVATTINAQFLGTDGIYYKYTNNKTELIVSAVPNNTANYAGDIIIPTRATITDEEIVEGEQTIELDVVGIDASAFANATGLKSVDIQANIDEISNNVFQGCTNLTSVTLPNSVSTIGQRAFQGTGLTSIIIPAQVTSIGNSAFNNCSKLTKATFESVKHLCSISFGNKEANPLYYAHHLYIIDNDAEVTTIQVASPTSLIGAYAFAGGSEITSITIAGSVNQIGTDAFLGCSSIYAAGYENESQLTTMTYGEGDSNPMAIATMFLVNGLQVTSVTFNNNVNNGAFKKVKWLKEVILNENVTSIGKEAFLQCVNLNKVTINGTSITSIGQDAFNGCTQLPAISLVDGLEKIGVAAFRNCKKISKITIPSTVNEIGRETFLGCEGLTEIDIQANLTFLPNQMFSGCYSLNKVTLANNIQGTGNGTFSGCNALTSIPLGFSIIQENAFSGCAGFTKLEIPESITIIGEGAFKNCKNLIDLTIDDRTENLTISSYAFQSSNNSLKHIYSYAQNAPGAQPNSFEGNTEVQLFYPVGGTGYDEEPWSNFNPTEYVEKTITYTIDGILKHEDQIQVGNPIVLWEPEPKEGWTFAGWQWPDGNELTEMPNKDFELKGYYTTTKLHDVTKLSYYLRSDNKEAIVVADESYKDLETAEIKQTVSFVENEEPVAYTIVAVDEEAFKGATKLGSADLSQATSLTGIGREAFSGCTALTVVKLPAQIKDIAEKLCYGCIGLTNIDLPDNVENIGISAFENCTALNIEILPSGLTTLGELAFCKSGVMKMTLPKSLNAMGNRVFLTCPKLETIVFEEGMALTTLPANTFQGCTKLKSFTLSSLTKTIAASAFAGCSSLERIIFEQDGLETISGSAFSGCSSLKEITLPATISTLGDNAFYGCNNITMITISNPVPPTAAATTFTEDVYNNASLYVSNNIEQYSTKSPWSKFDNRIFIIEEHQLNYLLDGKPYGEAQTLKAGTLIRPLQNPNERVFSEWKNLPKVMPNEDVTVTGSYEYELTYKDTDTEEEILKVNFFYGDEVINPVELIRSGYRYEIENRIETMPDKDIILLVKYYKTETDWTPTINNPNHLTYHIYTEGNNPHAELIPGSPVYAGDIVVPATIAYMNAEDIYTVTAIRANSFKDCSNITSVTLPETITSIGSQAFSSCTKLTEVTIPKNVETLGTEVFIRCGALKTVHFEDGSKLEALPAYTFMSCSALDEIDLPASLTTIANQAFIGCNSLKEITIPINVNSIGDYAFLGCKKLEKITIASETALPDASDNTFEDETYYKATLYVSETVQANIKSPWINFKNIELGGSTTAEKCATPKIYYDKGTLTYECDTPGAVIKSEITVSDAIKIDGANSQNLNKTYIIKASATAVGYKRSDVKEVTIVWQDGKWAEMKDFDGDVIHEEIEQQGVAGDMNGDGQVTAEDAALILKKLVGKENNNNQGE